MVRTHDILRNLIGYLLHCQDMKRNKQTSIMSQSFSISSGANG